MQNSTEEQKNSECSLSTFPFLIPNIFLQVLWFFFLVLFCFGQS